MIRKNKLLNGTSGVADDVAVGETAPTLWMNSPLEFVMVVIATISLSGASGQTGQTSASNWQTQAMMLKSYRTSNMLVPKSA
jgi:hypothetical protein